MEKDATLTESHHMYNKTDMVGIYKITNPNGKVYIGQSVDIEKRIAKYKWLSAISKQPQILRSITKHGWENHKWEVLEECNIDQLDELEALHKQDHIDTAGWDEALFCKIHDTVKDKHLPQSVKDKIGKSNTGKKRSDETKRRMSTSRTRGAQSKPCYQYDLNGMFIQEWKFREDAANEVNGDAGNITSAIIGAQKSAYGYQWRGAFEESLEPVIMKAKSVMQLDLQGNEIQKWNSASEAEKHFNPKAFKRSKYGSNNIIACRNGKQATAYGFKWK